MESPRETKNPMPAITTEDQQAVIPDFEVDALARCLLPKMQTYFASPEGQAAFEKWKQQQNT